MVKYYVILTASPDGIIFGSLFIPHPETDKTNDHIACTYLNREVLEADSVARRRLSCYRNISLAYVYL